MSGGTTGNILNAIEVDEDNKDVKNVILVSGQNDLKSRQSPEEFLLSLKIKQNRLIAMSGEKNLALLPPPL